MNKKTLAIILSIALAIGAFAGLSFNLFTANAVDYVGDGTELMKNGSVNYPTPEIKAEAFGSAVYSTYNAGSKPNENKDTIVKTTGAIGTSDTFYLSIPAAATTWQKRYKFRSNAVPVTAANAGKYIFSAYVRYPDATAEAPVYIGAYEAPTSNGYVILSEATTNVGSAQVKNEWVKISAVVDLAAPASGNGVYLSIQIQSNTDVVLDIDELSLQKAVEVVPVEGDGVELMKNGSVNYPTPEIKAEAFGSAVYSVYNASMKPNENKDTIVKTTGAIGTSDTFYLSLPAAATTWQKRYKFRTYAIPVTDATAGQYIFSAYVRYPDATAEAPVYIGAYEAAANSAFVILSAETTNVASAQVKNEWVKISAVVDLATPAEGNGVFLSIQLKDNTDETLDIDELSLQKVKTDSDDSDDSDNSDEIVGNGIELATNGNAESTELSSIIAGNSSKLLWAAGYSGVRGTVVAEDADGNGKAFKAPTRPTPSSGNRTYWEGLKIEAGTYVFTCKVKFPEATSQATLKVCFDHGKYPGGNAKAIDVVVPAGEWATVKLVCEANDAAGTDYRLGFASDEEVANNNYFLIDSISFQKVGAPSEDDGDTQIKYTENLFKKHANGSFANGEDVAPLYFTETTKWAVEIVSTDSQDNDGKSALVVGRGVDYAVPRASATDIIKAYGAGTYTFTAYVKSTGADVTLTPIVQMVWGESYNNDNLAAGKTKGLWKKASSAVTVTSTAWTQLAITFEVPALTETGAKGDKLDVKEILCYATDGAFNALFAPDMLVDNLSLIKEINGQENQTLIDQLGGTTNEGGNGGSNAGSSNTGDVLPVALIAVVVVSAAALVVVARRKREE